MTTGMSAPPMEWTRWRPSTSEMPVTVASEMARRYSCAGSRSHASTPSAPTRAVARTRLSGSRKGSLSGAEERRPASLDMAMSDPVKVTPPMAVARPMATRRTTSGSSLSPPWSSVEKSMKSETAVSTAARPTREWKPATVCGSDVGSTLVYMLTPRTPPMATTHANCTYTCHVQMGAMEPREATRPRVMPATEDTCPRRAVFCVARPAMPPMQRRPDMVSTTEVGKTKPPKPRALAYPATVTIMGRT
mmetsp:Transcript_15752/g.38619  ORF Transcript_15752/g.38619 Transcript_15752/m.38619 type:complete len:248 (-) Transcript_15752:4034-4777(-)